MIVQCLIISCDLRHSAYPKLYQITLGLSSCVCVCARRSSKHWHCDIGVLRWCTQKNNRPKIIWWFRMIYNSFERIGCVMILNKIKKPQRFGKRGGLEPTVFCWLVLALSLASKILKVFRIKLWRISFDVMTKFISFKVVSNVMVNAWRLTICHIFRKFPFSTSLE